MMDVCLDRKQNGKVGKKKRKWENDEGCENLVSLEGLDDILFTDMLGEITNAAEA